MDSVLVIDCGGEGDTKILRYIADIEGPRSSERTEVYASLTSKVHGVRGVYGV